MKFCDLHTHSTFSDGSKTPREIVRMAKEIGLSAVALTDHNNAAGLEEFMRAGEEFGVETVAGCEFSTDYRIEGREKPVELHIVGLFFPREHWVQIADYVKLALLSKEKANRRMIEKLCAAGYAVTFEEAAAKTDSAIFNRAHVAQVLVDKGYAGNVKEAFDGVLKEGNGFYVPAERLSVFTTIRFIGMYGGKAVLAHPFLNLTYEQLRVFLPAAKNEGLVGVETHYSEFDEEQTAAAEELARTFGLLESGGSDYHGDAKPGIALGTGRGKLAVPYEFCLRLRAGS